MGTCDSFEMKLWAVVSLLLAAQQASGCAIIPDEAVTDTRFTCNAKIRADTVCAAQHAGRLLRHARVFQEVADFLEAVRGIPVGCVRAIIPYAATTVGRSAVEQSLKFWETSAMYRPSPAALDIGQQLVSPVPEEPFDATLADSVVAAVRGHVSDVSGRPAADFVGFQSYGPMVSLTLYGDGMTPGFLAAMVRDFVGTGDAVKFYAAAAACDSLLNQGAFKHGMANALGKSGTSAMLLDCARAFASVRRFRDALATAHTALAVDPMGNNELALRVFMGWLLDVQLGEKAGAEQQYTMAFKGSPDHCVSSINLGWLYVDSGLFDEAVAVLHAAHKRASAGRSSLALAAASNSSSPSAADNASASTPSPPPPLVQIVGSLAPQPDRIGSSCGGAYTEKLYWNLGQATLEQRSLARVQQGRAWLRRPLCLSLAAELGASESELCQALELGIATFLDAIAAARDAARPFAAQNSLPSTDQVAAVAANRSTGLVPSKQLQQAVDAAIRAVIASASPAVAAAARAAAADRGNEEQLHVDGSYGLSIADLMRAHQQRTAALSLGELGRRGSAFTWLTERRPSAPWLLLHSAFATPQIMPLAGRDVRHWRRWALEAMLDLQQASASARVPLPPAAAAAAAAEVAAGDTFAVNERTRAVIQHGCVPLERPHDAVPDMPFAWQYHGFDDDAALQTLFSQLLACNYNTRTPVALRDAVLKPRAHELRAWRGSNPALTPAQAAVFAAGAKRKHEERLSAPLQPGPPPMRTTGDLLRLPFPFASPLRVGFMSKYFTLNHPHSQLLTGVLRRLDRSRFTPLLLRVINNDRGYFVDPAIEDALVCPLEEARRVAAATAAAAAAVTSAATAGASVGSGDQYADLVAAAALASPDACGLTKEERRRRLDAAAINIPHNISAAHELLLSLKLDVLVSADHVSEGVTQVLGFFRQAAAQAQYWGNPITTGKSPRFGSGNVDYYLSGELLELLPEDHDRHHDGLVRPIAAQRGGQSQPHTRSHGDQHEVEHGIVPARGRDFYSERLVLLPGSGIHYERITMPPPRSLCKCSRYGLPEPVGCPALAAHLNSMPSADASVASPNSSAAESGSSTTTAAAEGGVIPLSIDAEIADPYPVIEPNMRYMDALRPLALLRKEAAELRVAAAEHGRVNSSITSAAPHAEGTAAGVQASQQVHAAPQRAAAAPSFAAAAGVVRISSAGIVAPMTPLAAATEANVDVGSRGLGSQPRAADVAATVPAGQQASPRPIVFGCPQSLYKLRPEFDAVLAAILRAVPTARLLMVTERREMHTRQFQQRIRTSMLSPQCAAIARKCAAHKEAEDLADAAVGSHADGRSGNSGSHAAGKSSAADVGLSYGFKIDGSGQPQAPPAPRGAGYPACPSASGVVMPPSCIEELDSVLGRITWVGRQSGNDNYFALLSCADVLLHPFPFDGSKTAADGIAVALPMVTLPTNHLRGRMGYALYRSLGVHEALMAHNESHYVDLAVRLANDPGFRADAVAALRQRRYSAFDQPHSYGANGWAPAASASHSSSTTSSSSSSGGSASEKNPLLTGAEAREGVGASAEQVAGWESFFVQAVVEQANSWYRSQARGFVTLV